MGVETELYQAIEAGDRKALAALLAAGADPNAPVEGARSLGYSALGFATQKRAMSSIRALVQAGGALDRPVGPPGSLAAGAGTPLHVAAAGKSAKTIALLLELGAPVSSTASGGGRTPLHWTLAFVGSRPGKAIDEAIDALIAAGARIDEVDDEGQSLLFRAAERYPEKVAFVADRGARVDLTDRRGRTALHHAADHGGPEAIEALVALGAALDVRDVLGLTPLDIALRSDSAVAAEVAACLRALGG